MHPHIPVIVLTGGPCGGKTTILSMLKQKLSDFGFSVITVPEAATEAMLNGIVPGHRRLKNMDFQEHLLKTILEKEERFKSGARFLETEKKVIICDRGALDAKAYVSPHEFDLMIGRLGLSIVDLRDKRYDAVIFLRSVVHDKPELYTCINNDARKEGIAEARALDERTLAAWTGHQHLRVLDNDGTLEMKARRALEAVCRVLGIPEPLEIEKKFKITKAVDPRNLPKPLEQVSIIQYYLKTGTRGLEERIRCRSQRGASTYYHTTKQSVRKGVRIEKERQISDSEYFELLKRADPSYGKIEKVRYCFVYKNQYFELDIFDGISDYCLLEIELTHENDVVSLPPELQSKVKDVTGVKEYSNHQIAKTLAQAASA